MVRRVLRNDADKAMARFVGDLKVPRYLPKDAAGVSRGGNLDGWIRDLREQETALRKLRQRLEALQRGDDRVCPACGRPVIGRADAVYCSTRCRIGAHRSSKLGTDTAVSSASG